MNDYFRVPRGGPSHRQQPNRNFQFPHPPRMHDAMQIRFPPHPKNHRGGKNQQIQRQQGQSQGGPIAPYYAPYSAATCRSLMFCPKCKRNFDTASRTPLLLSCNHSLCEGCVKKFVTEKKGIIQCVECLEKTIVDGRLKDYLNVNYYLIGQIYYSKNNLQANSEYQNLAFMPAGAQLQNSTANRYHSLGFGYRESPTPRKSECFTRDCPFEASEFCFECNKMFCVDCCTKLHSEDKSMKTHEISQQNLNECNKHVGYFEEFYCIECKNLYCSYCALIGHKTHTLKQVSLLEDEDKERVEELLKRTEEVYRAFEVTNWIVKNKLTKMTPKEPSNLLEKTISKYFLDLHAHFQNLESKLLREACVAANGPMENLKDIDWHLKCAMSSLENLMHNTKDVLQQKHSNRQNIQYLIERMSRVSQLPCYLCVDESRDEVAKEPTFQYYDVGDEIEAELRLVYVKQTDIFSLYNDKNNLPEGYVDVNDGGEDESEPSVVCVSVQSSCGQLSQISSGGSAKSSQQRPMVPSPMSVSSQSPRRLSFDRPASSTNSIPIDSGVTAELLESIPPTPNFTKDHRENVFITYIKSPSCFYVHLQKQYKFISKFNIHLQRLAKKVTILKKFQINDMCLVKDKDDPYRAWRRGIIQNITKNSLKIQLIDYGHSIQANSNELKTLPECIENIPALALQCRLSQLHPSSGEWLESDKDDFGKMISDCDLTMIVMDSQDVLDVDLIAFNMDNEFSVSDTFVYRNKGVRPQQDEDVEFTVGSPKKMKAIEYFAYQKLLELNTKYQVVLTHADGPFSIFITLANLSDTYYNLMEGLNKHFIQQGRSDKPRCITKGLPVAVEYTLTRVDTDMLWYRGLIVDTKENEAFVLFVDVGYKCHVPFEKIRELPSQFMKDARLAVQVELADVKSDGSNDQKIAKILKAYINKDDNLEMLVVSNASNVIRVALFDNSQRRSLCLNAHLVSLKLLESAGSWSRTTECPVDENKDSTNDGDADTFCELDEEDAVDMSQLVPVAVTGCEDPDNIYGHCVRDANYAKRIADVNNSVQKYYAKHPLEVFKCWEVGDMCVMFDKDKSQYFRGEVRKQHSDSKFDIFCFDYGNVAEQVAIEYMGKLNSVIFEEPPLATRFRMYGVTPVSDKWALVARDAVKRLLLDRKNIFVVTVGEFDEDHQSLPAIFWKSVVDPGKDTGKVTSKLYNINHHLCSQGLAFKSKVHSLAEKVQLLRDNKPIFVGDSPEPEELDADLDDAEQDEVSIIEDTFGWEPAQPFTKDLLDVMVTYVDTKGYIYCYDLEYHDLIEGMVDDMTHYIQNTNLSLETWKVGDACSVKYHGNGKWYRGEVLSINKTKNQLEVAMIDYGNVEEVNLDEISKQLMYTDKPKMINTVELMNLSFDEKTKDSDTLLDLLHNTIVDKIVSIEIVEQGDPPRVNMLKGSLHINQFMDMQMSKDIDSD